MTLMLVLRMIVLRLLVLDLNGVSCFGVFSGVPFDDYTLLEGFKPEYLPCIRPWYESVPLVMGFMDNNGHGCTSILLG